MPWPMLATTRGQSKIGSATEQFNTPPATRNRARNDSKIFGAPDVRVRGRRSADCDNGRKDGYPMAEHIHHSMLAHQLRQFSDIRRDPPLAEAHQLFCLFLLLVNVASPFQRLQK